MTEWDVKKSSALIELYRNYPLLWNHNDRDYYNKVLKEESWKEISKQTNVPVEEIKNKMKSLWGTYRREKSRQKQSCITGTGRAGRDDTYVPKWFAFKIFDLLSDKNTSRHITDNLSSISEDSVHDDLPEQEESRVELSPTVPSETLPHVEVTRKFKVTPSEPAATSPQLSKHPPLSKPPDKRPPVRRQPIKRKTSEKSDLDEAMSLLKQSADMPKDSYYTYGQYISNELRKYDTKTLAYVKRAINDIIFQADVGRIPLYYGYYTEDFSMASPSASTPSTPPQASSPTQSTIIQSSVTTPLFDIISLANSGSSEHLPLNL